MQNYEALISDKIVSLRYFGSVCREDYNLNSDIDVLCVSNLNEIEKKKFNERLKLLVGEKASVSYYKPERIVLMYNEGHLFAWHLYAESKKFSLNNTDFIDGLGIPAKYSGYIEDINSFIEIIKSTRVALEHEDNSAVYEAGLLYLCARNISMCNSYLFSERADFGKYSPYNKELNQYIQFPLTLSDYESLMRARHTVTRGYSLDNAKTINLKLIARELEQWAIKNIDLARSKHDD